MCYRGFYALFYKEVLRFYKVFFQTIFAPVVTSLLYLLVFSQALDKHITIYSGISYTTFLVPGLVIMTVIQNSFANSSSSLIQSKVTGNIIFVLLAPLSHVEVFLAYILSAILRGITVGLGVFLAASIFIDIPLSGPWFILAFTLLGSAILATLGIIAGIWAEKFDQLASFQNFFITPLTFLSGVFYSIHSLPQFWQDISKMNPFFYLIDGFRYGFFGISDVRPELSMTISVFFLLILSAITVILLKSGYKLRN